MAERLRSGLQIRVAQFDSGSGLQNPGDSNAKTVIAPPPQIFPDPASKFTLY